MFLHVLGLRHWLLSVLDQLFKDFCMSNSLGSDSVSLQNKGKVCLQPEEEQIVSPHSSQSKEQVCLLPIIKDVGSPSPVFLPAMYHCVCRSLLALTTLSWGDWGSGKGHNISHTLATAIPMSNTLSFVSDQ